MGRKKRKLIAAVMAFACSTAMLLTNTFAWRSISQEARNEIIRSLNPGGRLHDDFNGPGKNKDVYVENFFGLSEGGQPIYARIRLDEYMEIGPDAGEKIGEAGRNAEPLVAGTSIENPKSWVTHIPSESQPEKCLDQSKNPFHNYWTWTMGGSTVYMPTFNKNADSLSADINGTIGAVYGDYHAYTEGEKKTVNAYYDADDNEDDEYVTLGGPAPGAGGEEKVNFNKIEETHTAKKTQTAKVLTMSKWKALGSPMGAFWVYDADGWAYWAQAIAPGDTTGLLMDGLEFTGSLSENCYYAINVVAQFVTKDDWGSPTDPVGFYGPGAGAPPTADALALLAQAAEAENAVTVYRKGGVAGDTVTVAPGESLELQAAAAGGVVSPTGQKPVWSVTGGSSEETKISGEGILAVGADEAVATVLTVQVKLWNDQVGSVQVTVVPVKAKAPAAAQKPVEAAQSVSDPEAEPTAPPEPVAEPTVEPEPTAEPEPTEEPGPTTKPEPEEEPGFEDDPESPAGPGTMPEPTPESGVEIAPTSPEADPAEEA